MGLSLRPLGKKIVDIFSADTQEDQRKRVAAGQPRLYADQQRAAGNQRPATNPGAAFFGGTARLLNTARAGARELSDTARMITADVTNNQEALGNVLEQNRRFKQSMYQPNSGLFGAGTVFNKPEEFDTLGAGDVAKRVGAATLGTAGETLPVGRGLSVAKQGLRVLPKVAAQGAAIGAVGSVGDQYIRTGEVDPTQVALSAATGGVLAAAPPALVAGARGLPKVTAKGSRPYDKLQTQIETAHNAGDTKQEAKLVAKLPDQGMNPNATLTPERRAEVMAKAGLAPASTERPKVAAKESPAISIDPNDPFGNKNLLTRIRNEAGSLVDDDAQMIKLLRRVEKETGKKGLVDQWMFDTGNIRASNAVANAKLKNSAEFKAAVGGLSKKQVKDFDAYAAARAELKNYEGMPTSKTPEENATIVATGDANYGQRFDALNQFYKKQAQDMYDGGLISKEQLDKYAASDDYIRIQRDMEDLVNPGFGSSRARSLGTTTANQKRSGSARGVVSPTNTAPNRTQQIQLEIQRNKATSNTLDVLEGAGLAKNLVNADDVTFRRDMYKFLSATKEGKELTGRILKRSSRELRVIQGEIRQLQADLLKSKKKVVQKRLTKELAGDTEVDAAAAIRGIDASTIEGAYAGLLELKGTPWFSRIRQSLSARDTKAAALMDEVSELADTHQAFKTARSEAYNAALARADQSTKNKNTIKRLRDGITEVYEVPADIKRVMDNVSPYQLGVIARVISAPTRLFRAGTTALSAPFTVTNYLRDQASSGLYSKSIIDTHNPANIISGLASASRDFAGESQSPLWKKFEEFTGDQTIYDELRNAQDTKRLMREVRGGQAGKIVNMVTQPIRTLEDLNSITEKATRFQNFKGIYEKTLRETGDEQEAIKAAVLAARQNSVDFQRSSSFTRAANLFIPYFNASVQGSRNVARSFRDRPVVTSMKSVGMIALPSVALTAYNLSDEKRREAYESINEFEKEDNFILVGPNPKQNENGSWEGIYKIPKPQGYRELTDPVRDVTEAFLKGEPVENVAGMFKDMVGGLSGPIDTTDSKKFVGGLIPQAAKPWIQLGMNKDLYTGGDIVPEFMREETDDPTKRAFKGTSGSARLIAKQLGVSPIQVEKAVQDVAGSLGRYGVNASDNALAAAGKIPEEQIGGRSIAKDFSRRLFEASGELLDKNKTAGRRYYEDVKEVSQGLNKNELAAFNSLHPSKTNFLGEDIFDENKRITNYTRAGAYLNNPNVLEADRKLDATQRRGGRAGNPLFDLPNPLLTKVLLKAALPPGSKDPELSNLYKEPWYQDYQNARSKYYDSIKASMAKEGKTMPKSSNPYPETPSNLQKAMDTYSALPKGTGDRSAWIKANPGLWQNMTAQWAQVDAWENKERVAIGLAPVEDGAADGGSGGFGSKGGKRSSSAGSAYKYAVSLQSGGQPVKPKVSVKKTGGVRSTAKKTTQPKVSIKKSRV